MILRNFFKKLLGTEFPDMHLLDVGASGGIDSAFLSFEHHLFAIGVDPLRTEIEKLNYLNDNPNIKYIEAAIEWFDWERLYPAEERERFKRLMAERLSSFIAGRADRFDYKKEYYSAGQEVSYTDRRMELDNLITEFPHHRIDFLKTDTDGYDFPVL